MGDDEAKTLGKQFSEMMVEIAKMRKDIQTLLDDRSRVREWVTGVSVAFTILSAASVIGFAVWAVDKIGHLSS